MSRWLAIALIVWFLSLEWRLVKTPSPTQAPMPANLSRHSDPPQPRRLPSLPPKMESLERQFSFAKFKIKHLNDGGLGGKSWRLQEAVLACRAVNIYWPQEGAIQAEAAYREGELWLRLEEPGDATGAFQTCRDAASGVAGCAFGARAQLQLAHIDRRANRFAKAVHQYKQLAVDPSATLRHRNDALEWQGRCWLAMGQVKLAAQAFAEWRGQCEGPLEEVRATDWQALAMLRGGEITEAEILLSALQSRLRAASLEPTPEGRELFEALGRIRADVRLRAIRQFGEDHGHRQVVGMTHRQAESSNAQLLGEFGGTTRHVDLRRNLAVGNHFDLVEGDAVGPAGTEAFHQRFLRGKTGGEVHRGFAA